MSTVQSTSNWGTNSEQATSVDSNISPPIKNKRQFLTKSDLIHPSTLEGLTLGKDYVLLRHTPGNGTRETILSEGLMSLEYQAQASNASKSVTDRYERRKDRWGNDPRIIYFRPTLMDAGDIHKVFPWSIVVATHPNSVNVYNQEFRANYYYDHSDAFRSNLYYSSAMSLSEYSRRLSNLIPGYDLNASGDPVRRDWNYLSREGGFWEIGNGEYFRGTREGEFIRETPVQTGRIKPEWFVDHATIPEDLKCD